MNESGHSTHLHSAVNATKLHEGANLKSNRAQIRNVYPGQRIRRVLSVQGPKDFATLRKREVGDKTLRTRLRGHVTLRTCPPLELNC